MEIAGRKEKDRLDRLLKVMMHPKWVTRNIAEQLRHANTDNVAEVEQALEFDFESELKRDGFTKIRVRNLTDREEYVTM